MHRERDGVYLAVPSRLMESMAVGYRSKKAHNAS